jgi:diguanylate cyclase
VDNALVFTGFISPETWLFGLLGGTFMGLGLVAWQEWRSRPAKVVAAEAPAPEPTLAATMLKLDSEAAAVLKLVQSYIDAGERYTVTLAQAGESLPTAASPAELGIIVKFLLAENAKMQNETAELNARLEQSRSQIDKLRTHLAEAQESCTRDPLTSLKNRRFFDDSLKQELADARARATALSLVMTDIDNFKAVNDRFGHQIGDEILKTFARVLTSNVGPGDTVVRYGGEEFAIILPATPLEGAESLAERMRSELASLNLAVNASGQ